MKKTTLLAVTAILATLSTASFAEEAPAKEKCYGVAKGGKNDCAWSGGSCAGSAKNDKEASAWILLPKGLCDKLAGSSLEAPKS